MNRDPSRSKNIRSVGYDKDARTLEVEFRNRDVYRYSEVPSDIHEAFKKAEYRGRHFDKHIRGQFGHEVAKSGRSARRGLRALKGKL